MQAASDVVTHPTDVFAAFCQDVYFSEDAGARLTMLRDWLPEAARAQRLEQALRRAKRAPTAEEQELLSRVEAARDRIVQVDAFDRLGVELADPAYVRPALRPYAAPAAKVAVALPGRGREAQSEAAN